MVEGLRQRSGRLALVVCRVYFVVRSTMGLFAPPSRWWKRTLREVDAPRGEKAPRALSLEHATVSAAYYMYSILSLIELNSFLIHSVPRVLN